MVPAEAGPPAGAADVPRVGADTDGVRRGIGDDTAGVRLVTGAVPAADDLPAIAASSSPAATGTILNAREQAARKAIGLFPRTGKSVGIVIVGL